MKKLIGLLIVFFVASASQIFAQGTACTVGQLRLGGGYIFYCDDPVRPKLPAGKIGLETAPSDQSDWQEWSSLYNPVGITDTSIGSGSINTKAIIVRLDHTPSAALLCAQQTIGGYSDWFLPSKDELNLMYTNLYLKNIGGFTDNEYWSSSERESGASAWAQSFWRGGQYDFNKYVTDYVRCARAF